MAYLKFISLKSLIRDFSCSVFNQVANKVTNKISCKRKKHKFKNVIKQRNQYAKTLEPYDQITVHNPKFCGEYVTQIHDLLLKKENTRYYSEFGDGRKIVPVNFISPKNRVMLFNFLYGLHVAFKMPDINTFFLAVQIFDRFAYKKPSSPNVLQLIGCTCLLMAEKMEEIYPNLMEDYVRSSNKAFKKKDMKIMEIVIVRNVGYQ